MSHWISFVSSAWMTNWIVRSTYDSFVGIFPYGILKFCSFIWWRGQTKPRPKWHTYSRRPIVKNCHHLLSSMNWINIVVHSSILSRIFFLMSHCLISVFVAPFFWQLSVLLGEKLLLQMNNCLFYHARHSYIMTFICILSKVGRRSHHQPNHWQMDGEVTHWWCCRCYRSTPLQ